MTTKAKLTEEEAAFSEIIGDLVEQWGFKRQLGRIWSLTFLREQPLNPAQFQEELSLSAGAVSEALSELQTWGVVKRIRIAGDRNFYYEAESCIWKSVANVVRARELRILEEAHSGLKALETSLKSKAGKEASFQTRRVAHVKEALLITLSLLGQLIDSNTFSLVGAGKLVRRLKSL